MIRRILRLIPGARFLYVLLRDVIQHGFKGARKVRAQRNRDEYEAKAMERIEPKSKPVRSKPHLIDRSDLHKCTPVKLDIIMVTYNSAKWVSGCFESIFKSDFDRKRLSIYIVDNNSSDNTVMELEKSKGLYSDECAEFKIIKSDKNHGFGKGNNLAATQGAGDYLFLLNIDTELYESTISEALVAMQSSGNDVAAWELRQAPHEHPKVYDAVTGFTSWCSAAALIINRRAFEDVGGFDEKLFMYAEDVDISWRLRAKGYNLRYIPQAAVKHFSYEAGMNVVKPTQYIYSLINGYNLRLKFGNLKSALLFKRYLKALAVTTTAFEGASEMLTAAYRKNRFKTLHFFLWRFLNRKDFQESVYKFIGTDYEDVIKYNERRYITTKKIAVHAHIFYTDLADEIFENLNYIPCKYDLYISTDSEEKRKKLKSKLSCLHSAETSVVEVFENKGRDVAPFIIQMKNKITEYDYICHIHTKKSLVHDEGLGDNWRKYLYKHLFGSCANLLRILETFSVYDSIGLIFPQIFPQIKMHLDWAGNKNAASELMRRLRIETELPSEILFPVGNMFWAKTDAVNNLFSLGLTMEDFPEESGQRDETLAHVIERIWVYIAQANGYKHEELVCD